MEYEKIFNESYARVLRRKIGGKEFFEVFYQRFVQSSGEVAEKFKNTDMAKQQRMVKDSLRHMLSCYVQREINDEIVHIAVMHNKANLDIQPKHYDLWLETLIETAREFDDEFDKYSELAWRIVLAIGITYMKFRYNHLLYKFR